jgi:hypothetical protein
MKKRFVIIAIWIVAILSLSGVIHAGKVLASGFSLIALLKGLVWLVFSGGSMFLLGLRTYALEKARGKVVNQIGVYERILKRNDGKAD